jgi:hypothetical protein
VIKFVSDLREVGGLFSPGPPVSSTDKTDRHDITEIMLKVVLNKTNKHLFIKLSSDLYFGNMYLGTSLSYKKNFLIDN